ncbi:MAG: VOC family protein [Pseudomonadota bacterium]
MLLGLDHIQLAIPEGGEDLARAFYIGALGFAEVPKPDVLKDRGGAWFSAPGITLHLGVETPFHPARKAHPAFRVSDLGALRASFATRGIQTVDDVVLPGIIRTFVYDPFGNRIELIEVL